MKTAITYENGNVMQHFGRCEAFLVCEIKNGEILSQEIVRAEGQGHGTLPAFLRELEVRTVICGNLGEPMRQSILANDMELICGIKGSAQEAAEAFAKGSLAADLTAVHAGCSHHH